MNTVLELHAFLDEVAWIDVVVFSRITESVCVLCGVDACDLSCCVQVILEAGNYVGWGCLRGETTRC